MRIFIKSIIIIFTLFNINIIDAYGINSNNDKNIHINAQKGIASWYRGRGANMSSCEALSSYTAGHKTLPFNTKVKVTNLYNNKSIYVTINDRGPFIRGRVIDLSFCAAKALGFIERGIVPIRLTW